MKKLAVIFALLLWASAASAYGPGQILAQVRPSSTTTTIYAVPTPAAGGQITTTVITTVWMANTDSSTHAIRLAVAASCAADAIAQYLYYGVVIPANSSIVQSVSLPLSSGDCVRTWVDADQKVNFELFGVTNQ